ncbi:glycerophosphodiester phosphodiesterase family protein [Gloeobacter kilaueensis]|uniref:Glycerophosphoryl diester phosphodiesterase n=1 Tax=Gloeobacter kilaueensis (strain ATCC BAA-2537 / CCAP 1431/1 / ULC 316 / JS1) TaxID=1183438 RepID=U5QPZ2_GLOK1|nr:glycerophosphodiester phosphodiesterase family protein [Gloeobacter kilaueensis]AGY59699.1 glycerophosphoryl diester phosphodiesterase [Gloeobacter kilaueensis JS1]
MPSPLPEKRPLIIAHRGASALVPENTLPAIEKALDLRVDGIELDLYLSRDSQVIISHDPGPLPGKCRLRTASLPADPPFWSSLTLSAIQDNYIADCSLVTVQFKEEGPLYTGRLAPEIMRNVRSIFAPPSLDQVFALLRAYASLGAEQTDYLQRLRLFLEIKRTPFYDPLWLGPGADRFEQSLIEAVERWHFCENVIVLSFTVRALQTISQHWSALQTGLLTAHTPINLLADTRYLKTQIWCPAYQSLDRAAVLRAKDAGLLVIPWTVNSVAEMNILIEWGADGIIADAAHSLLAFWR